jgi:hypothetical protein
MLCEEEHFDEGLVKAGDSYPPKIIKVMPIDNALLFLDLT